MLGRAAPLVLALLVGCMGGSSGSLRKADELMQANKPTEAVAVLEAERTKHPSSPEVRHRLGVAYYRVAREALEAGRSADYERNLELAMNEWIEEVRLDPASPGPHTMMAIVRLHQGDLDGSIQNLKNARRLEPSMPVAYTNLAEAYVYKGNLEVAHRYLQFARRFRGSPDMIEVVEALAAWKGGDRVEAEDLFASALATNPQVVAQWNEASLDRQVDSFDDFAEFCCGDIACGPYMEKACRSAQLAVERREVSAETVRKELQLEMERRRKLNEIYKGRKDLQIEVEKPEEVK
jgi:tetratricopeptide (TPR) repeat protein